MKTFLRSQLLIIATLLLWIGVTPMAPACSDEHLPKYDGEAEIKLTVNEQINHVILMSGEKPMVFEAEALPSGLSMDLKSGVISGSIAEAGSYKVTVTVSNKHGAKKVELTLVVK